MENVPISMHAITTSFNVAVLLIELDKMTSFVHNNRDKRTKELDVRLLHSPNSLENFCVIVNSHT